MNEDLAKQLSDILADKNIDINNILESFQNNSSNENDTESQNPFDQIDTETILKLQKIMTLFNNKSNTSDEQLLKALKPYMRDSRKEKIDQYIRLLHIIKIFENFQKMGGNINDFL